MNTTSPRNTTTSPVATANSHVVSATPTTETPASTSPINPDLTISVRGLVRTYGRGKQTFDAVRGIDLDVQPGNLFALLGTNGAGKTSTLEVLEGLAPATKGTVSVFGHDPYTERQAVRHRTGAMLQEAGFPDELTVGEMTRMWASTLTSPRPVVEALTDVDLTHRAGVHISALSGGEKRRLDLALATMGRPELLFLDEPTTGLDPESRHRSWDLVRSLLNDGTTVVLTTHYLEEAEELADEIAIMHRGVIAARGTLDQIVATEPASISFRATAPDDSALIDNATLTALPALAAAPRTERGRVELTSTDLQRTLYALLGIAHERGVHLEGLDARSASLEQVFLRIAGEDVR